MRFKRQNNNLDDEHKVIHVYMAVDVNGVIYWINCKTEEKYYHHDLEILGANLGVTFIKHGSKREC